MPRLKYLLYLTCMLWAMGAQAGTMGKYLCKEGHVSIPCSQTAWDLGLTIYRLQPILDAEGGYATSVVDSTGISNRYHDFVLDWDWSFQLEGSYHFGTGNDLEFSWQHFDGHSSQSNFFSTVVQQQPPVVVSGMQHSLFDLTWNDIILTFGQMIHYGDFVKTRLHAGLEYSQVDVKRTSGIPVYQPDGWQSFHGIGPRVGADVYYDVGYGFDLYGKGSAALLIGDSDFQARTLSEDLIPVNIKGEKKAMVPVLAGQLGIDYSWHMPSGEFIFDAGYQWTEYHQVVHVLDPDVSISFRGPYFGFKWLSTPLVA